MIGRGLRSGRVRRLLVALCCIVSLSFIYLSNGVSIWSGDTVGTSSFAVNFVQTGSLFFDAVTRAAYWPSDAYFFVRTPSGHITSMYPIGSAVLYAPLHLIFYHASSLCNAEVWTGAFESCRLHSDKFSSAVVAALSAVAFFVALRATIESNFIRWTAAIFFALGTNQFMISSQTNFQHGPTVFLCVLAMAFMFTGYRVRIGSRKLDLTPAIMGFLLGFLISCRPTNALFLPPFAYWAWQERNRAVNDVPLLTRRYLWMLAGIGIGLFGVVWNLLVFGHLIGGYAHAAVAANVFDRPLYNFSFRQFTEGLYGLLLSPGRGLLVFTPVAAITPIIFIFWRDANKDPCIRMLLLWLLSGALIFVSYCFFILWGAGWSFGPRYLTELSPIFILTTALVVDRIARWPLTVVFIALGIVGVLNQFAGAFGANGGPEGQQFDAFNFNDPNKTYFDWTDFPLRRDYLALYFKRVNRGAFFATDAAIAQSAGCILLPRSSQSIEAINTGRVAWIGFKGGSANPPVIVTAGHSFTLRDAVVAPTARGVFEDLSGKVDTNSLRERDSLTWGGRAVPNRCPDNVTP